MWLLLPSKRRKIALENIRQCINVDEKESARLAKISTVNLGTIAMEVLNFPRLKNMMKSYVKIIGLEYLTEYINSPNRNGRGAVIMR